MSSGSSRGDGLSGEGRIEDLLREEGSVRVRVASSEVPAAGAVLESVAGPRAVRAEVGPEAGWIEVRIDPARAAELNRALASTGVFASRIEAGTTLEALFLNLTGTRPDVGGAAQRSASASGGGDAGGGATPPAPGAVPGWPS